MDRVLPLRTSTGGRGGALKNTERLRGSMTTDEYDKMSRKRKKH